MAVIFNAAVPAAGVSNITLPDGLVGNLIPDYANI